MTLTNERLNERFKNPFELVNYAITLAKDIIERGEEGELSPANEVISLITTNQDLLVEEEEIIEE